jgi:hypothetical protein
LEADQSAIESNTGTVWLRSRRYLQLIGLTSLVFEVLLLLFFLAPAAAADGPAEARAILVMIGVGITYLAIWWAARARLWACVEIDPERELVTVFYFRRLSTTLTFEELSRTRLVVSRIGNMYLNHPQGMTPGQPLPALASPLQRNWAGSGSIPDARIPEPIRSIPAPLVVSPERAPRSVRSVPLVVGALALMRGELPQW